MHFRVFVEQDSVNNLYAEAYEGDIVGCGFDVTDVTFDESGVPHSNQFLNVYFTRNGGEVGYLFITCLFIFVFNYHSCVITLPV